MTFPSTGRCRLVPVRRTALGLLSASALVAAVVVPAGTAFADPAAITSKTDLSLQVSSAPAHASSTTSLVLGAPLTASDGANDTLTTAAGSRISIDLHGNALNLDRVVLGTDSVLTIIDSADDDADNYSVWLRVGTDNPASSGSIQQGIAVGAGARLVVDGARVIAHGSTGAAGIGSPSTVTSGAGTLQAIDDANIEAYGGDYGAGVGGGDGAEAIDVAVVDSSVYGAGGKGGAGIGSGRNGISAGAITTNTTPSTDDDGSHQANLGGSGGIGAAGIGGGLHANGGAVELSGRTYAYAYTDGAVRAAPDASGTPSTVGAGQNPAGGNAFGSLVVHADATLSIGDGDLHLPAGATIQNDGYITIGGTVSGDGTIVNNGDLRPYSLTSDVQTTDPGSLVTVAHVTGHNYAITLNPNGGTAGAWNVAHVYSAYWSSSEAARPTPPSADQALMEWTANPDGSGDDLDEVPLEHVTGQTSTNGEPVPLTAYARYGIAPHLTALTVPSAGLGTAYDQPLPLAGELREIWIPEYDEAGDNIPGLPAGLSFDEDTHHIVGTPTEAGTFRFRVGMGLPSQPSVYGWLTIRIAGAPVVGTTALPDGQQGAAYSTPLAATGDGTVTWDVSDGALPAGLTLSPSGVLSGTPTGTGAGTFTVRATSEFGSTTQALRLNVADAPAAPTPVASAPVAVPSTAAAPAVAPAAPTPSTAPTTTAVAPVATTAASPVVTTAAPPAAPALPSVPRSSTLFGHDFMLAVTASSTVPVRYAVKGVLPKGISLNPSTGVLSGVAAESGTFPVTVTATSSAGATSTPVTIVVPAVQELLDAKPVAATAVGATTTSLTVGGFQKGERYRVLVDGEVVRSGTMKKAGALKTEVTLTAGKHDVEHHIVVLGSRKVTDPAKKASASFTVTTLTARKKLGAETSTVRAGMRTVTATGLAAAERVTVRDGHKVVARGRASADGTFAVESKALAHGVHHLSITGASAHRTGTVTVKPTGR